MTSIDLSRLSGPGRPRRPPLMARRHVVVPGHPWASHPWASHPWASHPWASQAGMQTLEAGGDAAGDADRGGNRADLPDAPDLHPSAPPGLEPHL